MTNGVEIPKIGLGTWQVPNDLAATVVCSAIQAGYRHIDTAAAYDNETGVRQGIKKSGMPRNEIFITTKIKAETKTYQEAKAAIERSLLNLHTDRIDLMLIHAPKPWPELLAGSEKTYFDENLKVWKAMEEACKEGKLRAIGVSNFEKADLQNILDHCKIKPLVQQVKSYISSTPEEMLLFCKKHHILVEAFSPLATGKLLNNEELRVIAAKYDVSIPQICIKYALQRDTLPLPKTTHKEFMVQNADLDFVISDDDMRYLISLNHTCPGKISAPTIS